MAMYSVAYGVAHIAAPALGLKLADNFGFDALCCLAAAVFFGAGTWRFLLMFSYGFKKRKGRKEMIS